MSPTKVENNTAAKDVNLIVRADAGSRMGTGHVMRTLALAQAWQDAGGKVRFVMVEPPEGILARLKGESIEVVPLSVAPGSADDARQTVALARQGGAAWVVLDGYQFNGDYQRMVKEAGLKLLAIDDYGHAEHYWADLVLNQNLHAEEGLYRDREPHTGLLLGTRYALLRREFWKWRGWQRETVEVAHKVLVALGGGDPDNVTLKVLAALEMASIPDLEAVVLSGPANPHFAELEAAAQASSRPVQLRSNATDMPELMAWADVAVGAAGSTSWERAFMGLPSAVVVLADNQIPLAEQLAVRGAAVNLGPARSADPAGIARRLTDLIHGKTEREAMTAVGRLLVDGEGAGRIVQRMRGDRLRLRDATAADCELLWRWANDPAVRANSFSPDVIPWESHCEWFAGKLRTPGSRILIGVDVDDAPVGQVRLDRSGPGCAEIDVSVSAAHRGQGYGATLIDAAVLTAFRAMPVGAVYAQVKVHNTASLRAFVEAGFQTAGNERPSRQGAIWHVRRRDAEV